MTRLSGTRLRDLSSDDTLDEIGGWTVRKLVLVVLGWIVALALLVGVLGFVFDWFSAATDVVSPENVTQQFHDAYGRFESLKAEACIVKTQRAAVTSAPDANSRVQLQSQELAYEQNYHRIAAEYDAAYDNAFEAKHVGPRDLPRPAPELETAIGRYCG